MTSLDALRSGLTLPPAGGIVGGGRSELGAEEPAKADSSFAETLHKAVREVSELQQDAHDKAMALARGEPVQVHDVLIAMGKSEIAFNLALEVRNRLLQAWETLARTAV